MNSKLIALGESPFPEQKEAVYSLFQKTSMNMDREGIGYYDKEWNLILWYGQIIDLKKHFTSLEDLQMLESQESSLLIHDRGSYYLLSTKKTEKNEFLAFFQLLAFLPRFKTRYLNDYHFLKPNLLKNCDIYYWDFREDVSGFDRIFAGPNDEYLAEPNLQGEIKTLIFPLRNESGRIIATVILDSPSLNAKLTALRENILLFFYIFLGSSLILLITHYARSPSFLEKKSIRTGSIMVLLLLGLRLLFYPLSQLEKIKSLPILSPSSAGFISFWNLTKSPFDIFLTSFIAFLIVVCITFISRGRQKRAEKEGSPLLSYGRNLIFIALSFFLLYIFQEFLFRIVFHSSSSLLRFSFTPAFLLLHSSIIFFFLIFALVSYTGLKAAAKVTPQPLIPIFFFFMCAASYYLFFKEKDFLLLFLFQTAVLALILIAAYLPRETVKQTLFIFIFFSSALLFYASFHHAYFHKNRSLLQNSLQNIIKSQQDWGEFLIKQSTPLIDEKEAAILSYFRDPTSADLAHSLWENTLMAKFNWYSCLEMMDADEGLVSRFSLNIPELYRLEYSPPMSLDWKIIHPRITFLGKEKDFLIGYKDWFDEENYLGRTVIYVSVDYEMLPFLYSANPYYEIPRVTSIPSINQVDLGFAVFDREGQLLFNPDKLSSGISSALLERILFNERSIWAVTQDKDKSFDSLYFKINNRIYALFLPKKNFLKLSVEFFKLLFFYLSICLILLPLVAFLYSKERLKSFLRSFSNRVYISFIAISLVPLLLVTFSTRSFFEQIFSQQFTEKVEIQADFAKRVMDDFILTQQEDQISLTLPPDDVVYWISSIIFNDVNLYQDGVIVSSSRQEFFDYGFFPELIDGEIFYKIQYENNPFYTQTQKIGDYSFHTLTIPYFLQDSLLLISLPFPLEQQEIAKASSEMIELLLFISFFFIVVVIILARGMGGMIVNPIKRLLAGTREVSLGNLEVSIPHKHEDEMKTLIDGFNTMVKNLKKHQQDLTEMSKKAASAEMARKVAHEIKNPLTPIQLSAEHLLTVYEEEKENFKDALKQSVSYITSEVENLRKIAHEFLAISKEAQIKMEDFDLRELVQETIIPYKNILSKRIPIKETYSGDDFILKGDKEKIKIAIRNIFTNAIEAIRDHGEIKVILTKEEEGLSLTIEDTGSGMNPAVLKQIFDPYFSTKDMGTGLGLSIAKKIIEDHGGTIQAISKEKRGTQVFIRLAQHQEH
jgi:signal transduction histidine kinase